MRGPDKTWQFIEWSGVFWMTFAPPMVVASMFGIEIPVVLWTFMELCFIINILGKSSQKLIEARYGVSSKSIEITEEKKKKTVIENGDDVGG